LPGQYVLVENDRAVKVVTVTGPNKTDQSFKDDLDVNVLVQDAQRKGLLRHVDQWKGEYDDIPAGDFQEAQFIVAKGKSMFEALPSSRRNQFHNDPAEFMSFVQDPANQETLRKWGVLQGLDGLDAQGQPTGYNPNEKPVQGDSGASAPNNDATASDNTSTASGA